MRSVSSLVVAMTLAWLAVNSYRTGRVRLRGSIVTRKNRPAMYWLSLTVTVVMALGFAAASAFLWGR